MLMLTLVCGLLLVSSTGVSASLLSKLLAEYIKDEALMQGHQVGTYNEARLRARGFGDDDPCNVCEEHDDGSVTCVYGNCPYGEGCVDEVAVAGECCSTCPNGPNCWLDGEKIEANTEVTRKSDDYDGCTVTCKCPHMMVEFYNTNVGQFNDIEALCSIACIAPPITN